MLASSGSSSMAPHHPPCCTDTPKPALKGLAAAFKQVLSPRSSKQQHVTPTSNSNKQGSEMRHWFCGCAAARSNSSNTSADAYLESLLLVNRHSTSSSSSNAGSTLALDSRTASKVLMSPLSIVAIFDSKLRASDDWKSLDSTTCSLMNSRQPSGIDKFSSYHSSAIFEEQAADAAWCDFMSWRLRWMEVASQQRFSYREADLQRHEADLLNRLQHGSTITLCDSDSMRASHSSTSAAQASVPPVSAAQSVRDWELFLELPDFLGSGRASCGGSNGSFTYATGRRRMIVLSSISSAT